MDLLRRRFRHRFRNLRYYRNAPFVAGCVLTLASLTCFFFTFVHFGSSTPHTHTKKPAAITTHPLSLTKLVAGQKAGAFDHAVLDEQDHLLAVHPAKAAAHLWDVVTVPDAYLRSEVEQLLGKNVDLRVVNPVSVSNVNAVGTAASPQGPSNGSLSPDSDSALVQTLRGGTTTPSGPGPLLPLGILAAIFAMIALGVGRHVANNAKAEAETAATGNLPDAQTGSGHGLGGLLGGSRGAVNTTNSRVTAEVERPDTRFSDIAGCEEAVEELSDYVDFLTNPDSWTRLGAKRPKGALLVGPPGTGKTLLARAVAGEAGVPFIATSGSDFVEVYVGVGPQRIRAMFAAARKHKSAIIFIDEIDAIGAKRQDGPGRNGEADSTLNQLLTEIDGFGKQTNVLLLAATNRPEMLDPALTRPGRIEARVEVPNPDRKGREAILRVHARGKEIAEDVDFRAIADRTPGFSGAALDRLVNVAVTAATRNGLDVVPHRYFDDAVAEVAMGKPRKSAVVTDHDQMVTAFHEAGHTIAAFLQPDADDPVQVSIVPRGAAGGVTWMSGSDDIFLTRRKAHAQLVTAMAGRVGEECGLGGEFTQGACHDFQSATDLATRMVTQYGMTNGGFTFQAEARSGEQTNKLVEELLREAYQAAKTLFTDYRAFVDAVVAELLAKKDLYYADILRIAAECGVDRHAELPVPPLPTHAVVAPATGLDDSVPAVTLDKVAH